MLCSVKFDLYTLSAMIYGTNDDKSERPPLMAMVVTEVLNLKSSASGVLLLIAASVRMVSKTLQGSPGLCLPNLTNTQRVGKEISPCSFVVQH